MNSLKATNYLLLAIAGLLAGNFLLTIMPRADAQTFSSNTRVQVHGCFQSSGACQPRVIAVDNEGRVKVADK